MRGSQQKYAAARRQQAWMDALAAGLACLGRLAAAAGLLEESLANVLTALPFAVITVQEGWKALCGLKPAGNAVQDGLLRVGRTCAAIAAGDRAGGWMGLAVAIFLCCLMTCSGLQLFTGLRVQSRISRLQQLRRQLDAAKAPAPAQNKKKAEIGRVIPLRFGKNPL